MSVWEGRHPSVAHFEWLFAYQHLPVGRKRDISAVMASVAENMVRNLKDSDELIAGLRKLLEGKDCLVRCVVLEGD